MPNSATLNPAAAAQCPCGQQSKSLKITLAKAKVISAKRALTSALRELESAIGDLGQEQQATTPQV